MIRIAICDDQRIYLDMMSEICKQYFAENGMEYSLEEYTDGSKLMWEAAFDIVILDVEMPGINGIDIKNYIEEYCRNTRVLFVSNYPEAMEEAYGANVYGFLKKPVDYEKFVRKMDRVIKNIEQENRFILCSAGDERHKVFVKDIMYIEANGRYADIYETNGNVIKFADKSISEIEAEPFEELVRCHRSYIVNLSYVRDLGSKVKLKNGENIPLGRSLKEAVKAEFDKYILRR